MYAAILRGEVIDLDDINRTYPPTLSGAEIITVECDDTIDVGTKYNYDTKEFYDIVERVVVTEPEIQIPSAQELYENQLIIMEALADLAEMSGGVE